MTVELVIEAEWILKGGYWTKLRYPFQTEKGGWSDIDVLSYDPTTKHLVISESKVQGRRDLVMAYTRESQERFGTILEYDNDSYFSFLRHLPRYCADGVLFERFRKAVDRLTVQLVSNYVIEDSLLGEATQTVVDHVKKVVSIPRVDVTVMLDTTLDVFARVTELERELGQGRRHGHPVIDIAREINRYLHPTVRYAGRGRSKTDAVRRRGLQQFWRATHGPEVAALMEQDCSDG